MDSQVISEGLARLSRSITVKVVTIGLLILILLIPSVMVQGVIRERESRHRGVVSEVGSKWGTTQRIIGPVLTIPYRIYWKDKGDELKSSVNTLNLLPEDLTINGSIEPDSRYRGIYEVVVYTAELQLEGRFHYPDFAEKQIPEEEVLWKDITLSVGISDVKGISEEFTISWNNSDNAVDPGVEMAADVKHGVHARVPLDDIAESATIPFAFALKLKGSDELRFAPLGRTTRVELTSPWAHPSFTGEFLPRERRVEADGFQANWTVFQLNRNISQYWINQTKSLDDWTFGVRLFLPDDEYQQTTRSAKYAILFIALTFAVFFLIEISGGQRVHPIQYLLVGLALCIFYMLLLSLSEHIGFSWSYLLSSLAIASMVTLYTASISSRRSAAYVIGGNVAVLYGYLYFILQLEDYALLVGSLGLLVILALIMFFTRNIDWYGIDLSPGNRVGGTAS